MSFIILLHVCAPMQIILAAGKVWSSCEYQNLGVNRCVKLCNASVLQLQLQCRPSFGVLVHPNGGLRFCGVGVFCQWRHSNACRYKCEECECILFILRIGNPSRCRCRISFSDLDVQVFIAVMIGQFVDCAAAMK
jgi:hypothetical protein